MAANTDRMLAMIDAAVAGSAPFLPVRLVVFPEFAHAAPVYPTVAELLAHLAGRATALPHGHRLTIPRKSAVMICTLCSASLIFQIPISPVKKEWKPPFPSSSFS